MPVDRHFKRKAALDEATVKLERKRAAVGSAIDRLHGVVGELEDALCEARLELARPKPRLDVETVLTLAQRIGYSTSAPPRWRVRHSILVTNPE